jgi:hypothetical protein
MVWKIPWWKVRVHRPSHLHLLHEHAIREGKTRFAAKHARRVIHQARPGKPYRNNKSRPTPGRSGQEAGDFRKDVNDLVRDTPRTPVALNRFKPGRTATSGSRNGAVSVSRVRSPGSTRLIKRAVAGPRSGNADPAPDRVRRCPFTTAFSAKRCRRSRNRRWRSTGNSAPGRRGPDENSPALTCRERAQIRFPVCPRWWIAGPGSS